MDGLVAFLAARLDEDEAAAETWREHDLRPLREVEAGRKLLQVKVGTPTNKPLLRLISLPFKLLLFVLADGWHLVVGTLMGSFS